MKSTFNIKRLKSFDQWLEKLDPDNKALVLARVEKMAHGTFGDSAPVGEGISEARIHEGPGWRIYYYIVGNTLVLLMTGSAKSRQTDGIRTAKKILGRMKKRRAQIAAAREQAAKGMKPGEQ